MAASMIMAGVGGSWKVRGRRIAIPAAGPTPGSTPTAVPTMDPKKANIRFSGVRAKPKPIIRFCRESNVCLLQAQISKELDGRGRQLYVEPILEDVIDPKAAHNGYVQRHQGVLAAQHHQEKEQENEHGQLETEGIGQEGEEEQRYDDGGDAADTGSLGQEVLSGTFGWSSDDAYQPYHGKTGEDHSEGEGEKARARADLGK